MASFFDTLFGGGAEREAAERNRQALADYTRSSNNALDLGLSRASGAVTDAANRAGDWFSRNTGLYDDLRNQGNAILDRGRADSLAALKDVGAAYDPVAALAARYGEGTQLYLDSIGANGAAGNARAQAAFNAGPGYAFTRDQGIDALNRRRAAAGMLNSGNADVDALTYGTGLANQTYGSWQDRLAALINPELTAATGAATGRANAASTAANVINQDTAARLGLAQGVTTGQAGANTARAANDVALGNALSGLYTGDASNRVGIAGNNVSGQMAANNLEAQGQAQGARNLFNGGLSLATLATGALGGSGMFGANGAFGSNGAFGNMTSQSFGNGTGYQVNPWSSAGLFGGGGTGTPSGAGAGNIFNSRSTSPVSFLDGTGAWLR